MLIYHIIKTKNKGGVDTFVNDLCDERLNIDLFYRGNNLNFLEENLMSKITFSIIFTKKNLV